MAAPTGVRRIRLVIPAELEGTRLDHALAELLPKATDLPLSKGKVRKLIVAGAVYMNQGRIRIASKTVRKGMRLEVVIDPTKLMAEGERGSSSGADRPREWKTSDIEILYEDDSIVGLNKPAGLPTQPTVDEARSNLYALLKKYYFEKARDRGEKGEPYVGLHHRLDRDTSGVMLFTKVKEANAGVGKIFAEHLAQKTYLAIVSVNERRDPSQKVAPKGASKGAARSLEKSWTVENFLARESGKSGRMRSVHSGGDAARTEFRLLAQVGKYALVEAKPLTGRMHQIRVHLAEGGSPILGDRTYGGECDLPSGPVSRVMLHAVALTFPHPISRLEITFRAPLPADFESCLNLVKLDPSSADS